MFTAIGHSVCACVCVCMHMCVCERTHVTKRVPGCLCLGPDSSQSSCTVLPEPGRWNAKCVHECVYVCVSRSSGPLALRFHPTCRHTRQERGLGQRGQGYSNRKSLHTVIFTGFIHQYPLGQICVMVRQSTCL